MHKFINITDIDGNVHLINVGQLCCCDIERRSSNTLQCTLTFCDNISSFYIDEADVMDVFDLLEGTA